MSQGPTPMTMERLDEKDELILAQSTSQFCRCCCWQKSINWVISEQDNFQPGTDPFTLDSNAWIHEESSYCGRWWSWICPGCRAIKYVQHHGTAPASIRGENKDWCTCQKGPITPQLSEEDRNRDLVATHEKGQTCGFCFNFGDFSFPICNCCPLPYLETKDAAGKVLGKTRYICDMCCFVPKYDVYSAEGKQIYRIRPDTCCCGMCVRCRCDGKKGKCFRVPFLVRNPDNQDKLPTAGNESHSQIDNLWAGWKHECCTQKDAYHVTFPQSISVQEKLVLIGSSLLVDVTMFEQEDS